MGVVMSSTRLNFSHGGISHNCLVNKGRKLASSHERHSTSLNRTPTKVRKSPTQRARYLALVLAIATATGLVGCDRGPSTAPVHGKVTYKGKAVPIGTVTFYPTEGGRPAVGSIREDGSYELARKQLGDGVILGDYKVTIEAVKAAPSAEKPASLTGELGESAGAFAAPPPKYLVPEKYSVQETSDLTATVESGDNTIDFDLK